jgi:hypothetical protein
MAHPKTPKRYPRGGVFKTPPKDVERRRQQAHIRLLESQLANLQRHIATVVPSLDFREVSLPFRSHGVRPSVSESLQSLADDRLVDRVATIRENHSKEVIAIHRIEWTEFDDLSLRDYTSPLDLWGCMTEMQRK